MIHRKLTRAGVLLFCIGTAAAAGHVWAQNPSEASPAAEPFPETVTPQTFAPGLIEAGRIRFGADCGFCHGRDAAGGTGGTDLTRSALVAQDVGGDLIGALVKAGRIDRGMPAFSGMPASDLEAIAAFIHDQKLRAESASGGRRSVEVADLQTGNARAGERYFEAHCTGCHSASGNLSGVASRLEGLTLLRRMLYPGSEGPSAAPPPAKPRATVTTSDGRRFGGTLAYRDEFTIALTDEAGRYRSWPTGRVSFEIDDPLEAHVKQLAIYTDDDIHDVFAYLQTLREEE